MLNYVTIKKFAELSGYTEKAVREKIRQGIWPEGTICHHAPDGRLLISPTLGKELLICLGLGEL